MMIDIPQGEYVTNTVDSNPFMLLLNRYRHTEMTPDLLDHIELELQDLKAVQELKQKLDDEVPAFTTLFRYDPWSLDVTPESGGCFGYAHSNGARKGYARLFQELTADKIKIVRTESEAMVVIDHPSALAKTRQEAVVKTNEPTVLFTTRQFADYYSQEASEESELGLIIGHGKTPIQSLPDIRVVGPYIVLGGYSALSKEHRKAQASSPKSSLESSLKA